MRDDKSAARSLAAFGQLPFRPGTLADAHPPQRPNEVYETDLKLIFFDDPVFGHYQGRFDAIFRDPRYFDIARNLDYFAQLYRPEQGGPPVPRGVARPGTVRHPGGAAGDDRPVPAFLRVR